MPEEKKEQDNLAKEKKIKLESELERLKGLLNLGYELNIKWLPGQMRFSSGRQLSGEVLGGTIFIYEMEEAKAMATLRHEFVDYAISQVIEPYKRMVNNLISLVNQEAYQRKERLIERLCKLGFSDEEERRLKKSKG